MLRRARTFFHSRDVLEVDTPALSPYSTSDPNIDSLPVAGHRGATLYLQTSPESFMKRLLAGGYPDIFAICRADDHPGPLVDHPVPDGVSSVYFSCRYCESWFSGILTHTCPGGQCQGHLHSLALDVPRQVCHRRCK